MKPTSSLRERRRLQTEQEIAAAAFNLTVDRGYEAVTIEEICRAAGVSPRTFFNYFPSKEHAIVAVYPDPVLTLLDELDRRPAEESPVQALRAALLEGAFLYNISRDEMQHRTRLVTEPGPLQATQLGIFARFEEKIVEKLASRPTSNAGSAILVPLFVACCLAAVRLSAQTWASGKAAGSISDNVAEALDLLEAGFGAPQR